MKEEEYEKDFQLIENFCDVYSTNYYDVNGDSFSFYGVLLDNGRVNVKKFPTGRCFLNDLGENQNFLCFKRWKKEKSVEMVLRENILAEDLYECNVGIYEYIKMRCVVDKNKEE